MMNLLEVGAAIKRRLPFAVSNEGNFFDDDDDDDDDDEWMLLFLVDRALHRVADQPDVLLWFDGIWRLQRDGRPRDLRQTLPRPPIIRKLW